MNKEADEFEIFGSFVASELRLLKKENNRRMLKRAIQNAILDAADNESSYIYLLLAPTDFLKKQTSLAFARFSLFLQKSDGEE